MRFALIVAQGRGRRQSFRFRGAGISIGRDVSNDVVLNQPGVSRVHACIERRGEGWRVLDRGSANGTELNGRPLAAAAQLRDGDRIGVGPVLLEFRRAAGAARALALWRSLQPPARAALGAAAVLLFGVGVECAAHLAAEERRDEAGAPPAGRDPAVLAGAAPAAGRGDPDAARTAWERGRRKLEERRVAPRNLYDAWRAFVDARAHLEGVTPLPAFYPELTRSLRASEQDLGRECQRLVFSADRLERYGQPDKAQQAWREVLLHFPGDDPGGCHKRAQENLVSPQPDPEAG